MISRNRPSFSEHIDYGLYFYFSGLSLRKAEQTEIQFLYMMVKRGGVALSSIGN
jgi:hypothetical protein